jgi:hypothetical protein
MIDKAQEQQWPRCIARPDPAKSERSAASGTGQIDGVFERQNDVHALENMHGSAREARR